MGRLARRDQSCLSVAGRSELGNRLQFVLALGVFVRGKHFAEQRSVLRVGLIETPEPCPARAIVQQKRVVDEGRNLPPEFRGDFQTIPDVVTCLLFHRCTAVSRPFPS